MCCWVISSRPVSRDIYTDFWKVTTKVFLFVLGIFLSATTALDAQSPTQIYLNERDKAIAITQNLTEEESSKVTDATMDQMLEKLQRMLHDLIGPLDIKGFPHEGESNIITLENNVGFGQLDGVRVISLDGKTHVVVSTIPLLCEWLHVAHRTWSDVPANIRAALKSGGFYSYALDVSAHAYKYADIPVTASVRNSVTSAILFRYGQDDVAPYSPNKLGLSITRSNRVFVFTEDIKNPISVMAICKDSFENDDSMGEAANLHFLQCFGGHVSAQDYYLALVRQAQSLIHRVKLKSAV
jgi:hypothetical protein